MYYRVWAVSPVGYRYRWAVGWRSGTAYWWYEFDSLPSGASDSLDKCQADEAAARVPEGFTLSIETLQGGE